MRKSTGFWALLAVWITLRAGALQTFIVAQEGAETGVDRGDVAVRAKVERLISQLGADEFSLRDQTEKELRTVGDELLFKPNFSDKEDLAVLDRFHNSFVLPLHRARTSDDPEIRTRAESIFREFAPAGLIGDGPDGWALYAVHRLIPELPTQLSEAEYFRKFGKPGPRRTSDEYRLEAFRQNLRRDIERLTLIKRSHEDPEGMAESILDGGYRSFDPSVHLAVVASVWAADDFDAALRFFSELHKAEPYGVSKFAFARLIEAWPEDHPRDTAYQWIANYEDKGEYIWWPKRPFYEFVKPYAREKPEAAFLWANRIKSPRIRNGMSYWLVRTVSEDNLKLATELTARVEDWETQSKLRILLLRQRAEQGEKIDDAVITGTPRTVSRDGARSAVVEVIAKTDPEAAIKLADKIQRSSTRRNRYGDIAESWGSRDEAATRKWISTIQDDSLRRGALYGLVRGLSTKDLPRAIELVESLRGSTTHLIATFSLVRELAKSDPLAALELLEKTDHPEGALSLPKGRVAAIWAQHDPAKAANWVAEQQDEVLAVTWNREVAKVWASSSASGAAGWAASLPSSEARIFAFVGIVEGLLPNSDVLDTVNLNYVGNRND